MTGRHPDPFICLPDASFGSVSAQWPGGDPMMAAPQMMALLLGAAFAALSDHLVDDQALDVSLDTEAIMREALRPFLRVPVKPTIGGAKRLPAAARRTRAGRTRRGR